MSTTYHIVDRFRNQKKEFSVHQTEQLTFEGHIFLNFVSKWGMVIGTPVPGKDEKTLTPMPVNEVISRASEMTKALCSELRSNGWVFDLPPFEELIKTED